MKRLLLLLVSSAFFSTVSAAIRLPKIFGDGMVVQRDQPITVWGWADAGERVAVQFNRQKKNVRAGKDGRWKLKLDPEKAGGPYTLVATGKTTITLRDVLVGDVWLCSGQSNMEWPVSASRDAAQETAAANFPQIRHFKVRNSTADTPKDDLLFEGSWQPATPHHVAAFTAVGYFFARELNRQLQVPVGLINSSWGGTDIETWISREAFENNGEFKNMIAAVGRINLDSAAKVRADMLMNRIRKTQPVLPDAAMVATWPNAAFNDAGWARMKLPALWEAGPLPDLDGVVWFRKTIDIGTDVTTGAAQLHLGMIDDADVTYVNGQRVGSMNVHNDLRSYVIPGGVLKAGKNVIAVRVHDTGGGGGIYADSANLKLVVGRTSIPLAGEWSYAVEGIVQAGSNNPNAYPTLLYNAMIHPLIPFAIKGVIWYQGESNAGRAHQYRTAFPLLIEDWRTRWGQAFPFYFVQLASFGASGGDSKKGSTWAELREAQTITLKQPHTGMAVTTDIGETGDIHPKNKQDVGLRLAAVALHDAYGKNNVFSGPVYQSLKVDGNKMLLTFDNRGGGLMAHDKYGYLKGFEVAGADQKFYYAKAFVQEDRVVVYADDVAVPVAVRYAWADDAGEANLFNRDGFPAVPFRTDAWPGITEGATYRNAPR